MKLKSIYLRILAIGLVLIMTLELHAQQNCDSLKGEVPAFCRLLDDDARREFPKDYAKIATCMEIDSVTEMLLGYDIVKMKALQLQKEKSRLFTYGDWIDMVVELKTSKEYRNAVQMMELVQHRINRADWEQLRKLMKESLLPDHLEALELDKVEKMLFDPKNMGKKFIEVMELIK
ncbi:hypothetical protein OHD16_04270 [Sphingobacterium sp. ML3W]|uniref:hypothetical protein n=1 Tax=Sphingobacterium sp. ML3W TaxID=1538644 RepID=UPI00249ABC07|nr:hypothetical protein [Sphingobacterium sp. ML3W]WFA79179.1 hypothetical protein OGI71_24510 [Sphingobacterium sp. ML3W]